MRLLFAAVWFMFAFAGSVHADATRTISGIVTSVHDGDTFHIGHQSIRIWGIDALELKQPGGDTAQSALSNLILNQSVTCTIKGRSHKRLVGQCFVGGHDIGATMVSTGMAFKERYYSHGYYDEAENVDRTVHIGIWAFSPLEDPWHWRACNLPGHKKPADCA